MAPVARKIADRSLQLMSGPLKRLGVATGYRLANIRQHLRGLADEEIYDLPQELSVTVDP